MSILYCRNCGAKIEYTLQKPIACYKCNKNLSIASLPKSNIDKKDEEEILYNKNSIDIKNISKKIKISIKDDGEKPVFRF